MFPGSLCIMEKSQLSSFLIEICTPVAAFPITYVYFFFLEQFSQKREYNQHQSYDDRLICIPLANR